MALRHTSRTQRVCLDWLLERLREDGGICLRYVKTKDQTADIFTKAVDKDTFLLMRRHLLNLGGDETGQAVQSRVARLVTQLTGLVNHI